MITLGRTYTYEELFAESENLCRQFFSIADFKTVGCTFDGREIPFIKLGTGRKIIFCTGGVHGRESTNSVVMLKMVEQYGQAFQNKEKIGTYDVARMLNEYSLCLLPLVNPDGYTIAVEGYQKIKNPILRHQAKMKRLPAEEWKYNGRGIDINRNFLCRSYRETSWQDHPGSEAETKILMKMFEAYPSEAYIDFHSRGKIIYYYRGALDEEYNKCQEKLAGTIQQVSGYQLGTKEDELLTPTAGGNTVQYYSENYRKPAITVETVEDEAVFPLDAKYQEETLQEILEIPLALMDALSI